MRIHEILKMIKENFILGVIALLILAIIGVITYFFVYQKLLGGKKKFSKKQLILGFLFIGYLIMVAGVTFLSRGENHQGNANLHFLSSYREAWNTFSLRNWQFLIFNILMFVPFGVLLPLCHKKFKKIQWTIGAAFLFTLLIEFLQLVMGFGVFELDDLFNNTIGALIGCGITVGIWTIVRMQKPKALKVAGYFSPLLLVVATFIGIFTYYQSQEFGNLDIAHHYKINMKDTKVSSEIQLNYERKKVAIYQAPSFTGDSAKEFAILFYKNMNVDPKNMEIDDYNDNAIYSVEGKSFYSIWVNFMDTSYRYTDFSSFDEEVQLVDTDSDILLEELATFNIHVPKDAVLKRNDTGNYTYTVEQKIIDRAFVDGSLSFSYYSDGTVKSISNNLTAYSKVKDVPIKSEEEAYEELIDGKFRYYTTDSTIESIEVKEIKLDYFLDSKGFYQPVYSFHSVIDGEVYVITIPALSD